MRRFGRQCRGQGKIFVTLVRQTETELLVLGSAIAVLVQEAHQALQQAPHLSAAHRADLPPPFARISLKIQRLAHFSLYDVVM